MIKNLQNDLYTLEGKQAKGDKIRANIKWDLEREKCSKTFFNVLERQNIQNQTIAELYIDDKKTKYSNNLKDILKSAKKFYENLQTRGNISRDAIDELLNKIPNSKKISNEYFNLCEAEISLDKITEAINSQKNNKFPGNDGLTTEFYKHVSSDIVPMLLYVYNS